MKLKIGLFIIFLFLICGFAYADDGPSMNKNQAQAVAQDYLNTHGYSSYKAVATDKTLAKVTVKSTGQVKWIDAVEAKIDSREDVNEPKYNIIISWARVINVQDQNGKKVGEIYVDVYDKPGTIVYKSLPGSGGSDSTDDSGGSTNGGDDLTFNGNGTSDNNSGGLLGGLQDFLNELMSLLQQLWSSIFGGS